MSKTLIALLALVVALMTACQPTPPFMTLETSVADVLPAAASPAAITPMLSVPVTATHTPCCGSI